MTPTAAYIAVGILVYVIINPQVTRRIRAVIQRWTARQEPR